MTPEEREYQRNWKAKYRSENREKYNAYMRDYNSKNRDKYRAVNKAWSIKNKDKVVAISAVKRARKRNATVGCRKAIAKVYERARWWKQWFDVAVDHIIPLVKDGKHTASNLQIIYAYENCRKKDSLTYRPRVVFL